MQNTTNRNILDGKKFDKYFPSPLHKDPIVIRNGNVLQTAPLVQRVVMASLKDTEKIAPILRGNTLYDTCKNIWNFAYNHIRYKLDKPFVEQVRTPSRAWADRNEGIDCDCYTAFCSSILVNLGIPHTYRIAAYGGKTNSDGRAAYQHIYIIVPANGKALPANPKRSDYLVIDPVKDAYNDEHPYSALKDYPMDMQVLNGLNGTEGLEYNDFVLTGLGKVHVRRGGKVSKKPLNLVTPETKVDLVKPSEVVSTNPATNTTVPVFQAPSRTWNYGTLKNGTKVSLGDEVPTAGSYVWNGSGSQNGVLQTNRKFLVNGEWDGKTVFTRFNVHNGVLWANKIEIFGNRLFVDNGSGLRALEASIRDPGVPFGSVETEYSISTSGFGATDFTALPGLFIPQDVFETLWANRKGSASGASGLAALGELLGLQGLAMLSEEMQGFGNFELEGLDDINGIAYLPNHDLMGLDAVDMFAAGLGNYLNEGVNGPYDTILTMDGLGRTARARVRRKGRASANASTPAATATASESKGKKLGLYIPGNTLKNLVQLYNAQVNRLKSNGHKIDKGSIAEIIDGQANGLGSWFKDVVNKAANAVSKVSEFASPITSLIPGGQVLNLTKIISDHVASNTKPSENNPSQPNQLAPVAQVTAMDYINQNAAEAQSAYNMAASTSGLEGVPMVDSMVGWVKENPVASGAIALGAGWLAWETWFKNKPQTRKKGKGTNGLNGKKSGKGHVQKFEFKSAKH